MTIQESWINAVKSCGQSLIDNAEKIAGDFDFQTATTIFIEIEPQSFPEISVTHSYIPRDIQNKKKAAITKAGKKIIFTNEEFTDKR